MNKRKYKNYLWGYFFVAPTIIGLLILNIYPIFKTLLLSFSTGTGFEEYVFSGLNNFARVLKDREVWIGLRNTLISPLFPYRAVSLSVCFWHGS